jgi:hypothetical protein
MIESRIDLLGELSAVVHRADGTHEDLGVISGAAKPYRTDIYAKPLGFWARLWARLRTEGKIPASLSLATFAAIALKSYLAGIPLHEILPMFGLVTTAGVNYMATDFASGGASPRISAFNFHDCGTGKLQGSTNALASPFASNATPVVITETAHGRTTNDLVTIAGVTTNTGANGDWQILVLTANTYSLYGSVGNGVAGGSPTAQRINGAADTALTTAAGTSRVAGTQSNPSANVYKTIATIPFTGSLTISEWALLSASSSGTLWDRRWFNTAGAPATTASAALVASTIGVNNADSITFSYSLSVTAGGS